MKKEYQNLSITEKDGIFRLVLDMHGKGVNVLGAGLVEELSHALAELGRERTGRGLIVVSGKPKQFIAGANIEEIFNLTDPVEAAEKAALGQQMMFGLENLPFPSVCVIDGPTLGGGLEFALSATYRVAGDGAHVRLALPEVQLGIIPGWGGTQRMPKLVGFAKAVELITSGKSLNAIQAFKIGLVDDVAPSPILEDIAWRLIDKHPRLPVPRKLTGVQRALDAFPPYRALVATLARRAILRQTSGFYPAPLRALDVLAKTYRSGGDFNYELEAKEVGQRIVSRESKALVSIFQGTEDIRKTRFVHPIPEINRIGVLGAGVMGGGIAHLCSAKGKKVRIKDIAPASLLKALTTSHGLSQKQVKRKKLSATQAYDIHSRVSPTLTYAGFASVDAVIEAVVENMEIKKKVLEEVSAVVAPDCLLATNTSALSITEMAKAARNPERVVGLHFFNPVHRMPLIEVVRGQNTSDASVERAVSLAITLGKTPIVVLDRPGFLVNRILGLYLGEALRMLEGGYAFADIEKAMKDFGMPMGPFELMDEVGLDVAIKVGQYLSASLPHFPKPSPLFEKLAASKRLGKKSGLGFYDHRKKKRTPDTEFIASLLNQERSGAMGGRREPLMIDIAHRLVFLMVNEGYRCLEEGVALSERDVNLGMVLGTGFAPFHGGLLAFARAHGLAAVKDRLIDLAARHGEHYAPVRFFAGISSR